VVDCSPSYGRWLPFFGLASGFGEGSGKEVAQMCQEKNTKGCEHAEKLQGKPEECTPEQIKECHGEGIEHPCAKEE